ncbi:hypothetical protein F511_11938 [Dorcoceras hygrometricum]|uniref:Uncharacterized protein n=1 Tax=Dorcoceras hygrometricum TaxID=472368 RepID=A0A2Z7CN02_9LAMI|nr:hypothetical protein F511_11938 [Dorcoceras hygrometricum]
MIKHDVRLEEPTDYRAAVNKSLHGEQDWKVIEEDRQLKRQAFQNKDHRKSKKPNKNQQGFDQQPLRATVLPAPATNAGALPDGPPPGPASPNLTSLGPNHGRTREHDPGEGNAPRGRRTHNRRCEIGAQPAMDHQTPSKADYFRNFEW